MKPMNCAQALLIACGVDHQVVLIGHKAKPAGHATKRGPGRRPAPCRGEARRKDKLKEIVLADRSIDYVEFWPPESKLQRAMRLGRMGVRHG